MELWQTKRENFCFPVNAVDSQMLIGNFICLNPHRATLLYVQLITPMRQSGF